MVRTESGRHNNYFVVVWSTTPQLSPLQYALLTEPGSERWFSGGVVWDCSFSTSYWDWEALYQAHYTASLSLIETLHKGGAYKFGPSTGTGK